MELSITTIGAMGAGVGVLVVGLTVFIVILLVRAHREHKRHMADLEERGYAIVQTRKVAKRNSITKPRAVLRRDTILPFNSKSGWGNLTSVETIDPPEPPSFPPHYAPLKPAGFVPKPKRLSWPFLGRRVSGRAIPMRKIRVPVLSTVLESPKPSPLVPVLSGPREEPSSPRKSNSRPSSDQSLLQHHPALRNQEQSAEPPHDQALSEPLRRSLTAKPVPKTEIYTRPVRSQSLADIRNSSKPGSMTRFARPQLHERSVSTSSQASGNPPDAGLPILPLEIARIKSEARRRSVLSRSPSRQSNSSYESAGSSILAVQPSPILRSPNSRVQKVARRDMRNCTIVGPRPFRDTLTLHGKNNPSQGSIKSSTARFSSATSATQAEKQGSLLPNSSSLHSIATVKTAESVNLSKLSSPVPSAFAIRNSTTPKRRSGSYVTPYGSPENRRSRSSMLQNVSGNQSGPKRELSQTSTRASSTRSSNDNPFQWDPAPVSAGKPSALKGSPSARKPGHKRQNCVRISLIPTLLGPQSRSPSPAIHDIAEESPQASFERVQNVGLGFSSTRSLPSPPSTSIFAPELKFNATSIRASLAASSPTLPMANFDHGPIGTPIKTQAKAIFPDAFQYDVQRMSTGSVFSLSTFPSPGHNFPQSNVMISPPPMFALSPPSNDYADDGRPYDEMAMVSSPFEVLLDINSSPGRPLILDQYDTEDPYLVHQTPTTNLTRNFSSPFSTIFEEPCPNPESYEQLKSDDSPPCSPKSMPSGSCSNLRDRAAYNLPIRDTAIPEEPLETIDPAILSKDAFTSLNSPFDNRSGSTTTDASADRKSMTMPTSATKAMYSTQPLLDAAFQSSPPVQNTDVPSVTHAQHDSMVFEPSSLFIPSSPTSICSSPSPSPLLPKAPSSPRPAHAQLPTLTPTLNFAAVPTLAPSGPRGPPARSLRSSIQTLRRMNSDTKKGSKAERRYANLGREDSIALPGEESWLEDLDKYEDENEEEEMWDEEKGRALVGDLGFDWEEDVDRGASVLDLYTDPALTSIPESTISASSTLSINSDETVINGPKASQTGPSSTPARDRGSCIWEDGEKFWGSTSPLNSPNKPANRFLPLSSSPVSTRSGRKRAFEVAKDEVPAQEDADLDTKDKRQSQRDSGRFRKRSVLGVGTPNVKINVVPPSSGGLEGTPGSLYDGDGFLRG
ncbi:uncharacterized protein N0V89_010739 [Didymosphaeria variabile]|uniref:Uncharacterized protein n=1 Tax=Didymosphaeria variabile TaxID=1932322 RepID=A0A9W9C7F9_9PLEO|nr:uncharacterized protein N0V89_010739 [Didymosphaeria variabile]KAJ4346807.1 hypothetical protein N0V89_010739 [Didymosphaeria variabile]